MLKPKQDPLLELSKKVTAFDSERESFAKDIARKIVDDTYEQDDYEDLKERGGNPKDHAYYKAMVIIGAEDEVLMDFENYEEQHRQDEKNGLCGDN